MFFWQIKYLTATQVHNVFAYVVVYETGTRHSNIATQKAQLPLLRLADREGPRLILMRA